MSVRIVTSRKGRVSRNSDIASETGKTIVTSRKGRVSRNKVSDERLKELAVTSRKGRVSRNHRFPHPQLHRSLSRPARGV